MRPQSFTTSLTLVAICCLLVAEVSAFVPYGRRSAVSAISKTETHQSTFLVNAARPDTRLNAETLSNAAATQSFLSTAPLLLAPLAALAAGSQALSNKEKLELDVYATEIELDDIKQKLKNSQLQATSSFALALASAGFVAANTFGNIPPTQSTSNGNAITSTLAKTEVLSPTQQNSASMLLEKMDTLTSGGEAPAIKVPESPPATASDDKAQAKTPKEEAGVIPGVKTEDATPLSEAVETTPPQADVAPVKKESDMVNPGTSIASQTDGVMSKLDAAMKQLSKPETTDSQLSESTTIVAGDSTVAPSGESSTVPSTDSTPSESSAAESAPTVEDSSPAKVLDESTPQVMSPEAAQAEAPPESLLSKLQDAMKSFAPSKPETVETPDSPMAESIEIPESPMADSSSTSSTEQPSTVESPPALAVETEDAKAEAATAGQIDSQTDGLMSKLDEAMKQFNSDAGSAMAGSDSASPSAEATAEPIPEEKSPFDNIMAKLQASMEGKESPNAAAPPAVDTPTVESTTADQQLQAEGSAETTLEPKADQKIAAETTASPTADATKPEDEGAGSTSESTEEKSPFDKIMAKLEASTKNAASDDVGPTKVDTPTAESTTAADEPSPGQISAEGDTAVEESSSDAPQLNGESTPADITAAAPENPTADSDAPVVPSGEAATSGTTQSTPTLKEDDVFPTTDEAAAGQKDGVEAPTQKEETAGPILAVPSIQTPAASTSLPDIRIPGLENMDPAVYQSAAAIAAGAVLVGILASVGDDTATMPVGKKEEKSDYLDGLTRSSSTSGSIPDKPSSYVDTLNAKATKTTTQSTSSPGTGSYLENLAQSKQTGPGYGLPNPSSNGAKVVPASAKQPLTVTNAGQSSAYTRPPEDPRASIPKSQFNPPTEKPRPTSEPPKQVTRQRIAEPPKNVPGLSYLESMAVGAEKKVPPPIRRNPTSNGASGDTPKAVPGLSYLERMAQGTTVNGSGPQSGVGQSSPNGSAPQFQSFSDGLSRPPNGQAPPNGAGPPQTNSPPPYRSVSDGLPQQNGQTASTIQQGSSPPFQSFSDGLTRQNGQTETATATERMTQTNVGSKADQPKPKAPVGFGSYLDSL